jgi:heme/copper-type cytochrome/quinol oxidase subunit 2
MRMLVVLSAVCYLLSAVSVSACPVCFGDPNSAMTKGASNGILFLLGIIGIVQIGFVALFVTFWRRARAMRRRRESFHLIEGGAH